MKTFRWPVVVVVSGVLAAGILVGTYWDRVDHTAVGVDHAAASGELRSPDIDVRIQGVQALQRIAVESPGDQPAVTSELSSFIRSTAGTAPCADQPVGRDVQAALSALRLRSPAGDLGTVVDLHGACLNDAQMANISLVYANLAGVDFGDANLSWSVLDGADLTGANLGGANLSYAHVVDARMASVNLSGAKTVDINVNYSR
ncbi:pentapeptide repeat-containing protein [Kutzneria sp. CA-103260]|uniref:pentapeptide repeat-containing protein n=1 Tax=Kutzneria sp. CA-103260 TaxID=2802641 RepID=UPI001BA70596|nr:pentapeptide repeat-containing protein [Kutzneria sp. CA-103260]QUQ63373.1 Pentapeptide repeats (8 copies) [Kutzneria sp. CA-103260]